MSVHIGFPFALDARGRTALVDDGAYARGLIEHVLFTAPGERVNRPTFGAGLQQLVFEPAGGELLTAAESLVHGALARHLADQVEVQAVEVELVDVELRVTVRYRPLPSDPATTTVFVRAIGSAG